MQEKLKILQSLMSFLILALLSGCQTNPPPKRDVAFWAGDSSQAAIVRQQDEAKILCSEPRFDEYVCETYEELEKLGEMLNRCEKWNLTKEDIEYLRKKFKP